MALTATTPANYLAPQPAGVPDNRAAVQAEFPLTGTKTLSVDGKPVTFADPFEVFTSEFSMQSGLVPLKKLQKELAGTGLQPIVITKDGKQYGSVFFGINRIDDSSIAKQPNYKEAIVTIQCVNPAVPQTAKPIAWTNYTSSVLPALEGAAQYAFKLALDNPEAISFGRHILAFDKEPQPAQMTIDPTLNGVTTFSLVNAKNHLIASGSMPEDYSANPTYGVNQGLIDLGAAAAGAGITLPPPAAPGTPTPGLTYTRDPIDPKHPLKQMSDALMFNGPMAINPVTTKLSYGRHDVIARKLSAWGYQPDAVWHATNVAGMWSDAVPAQVAPAAK